MPTTPQNEINRVRWEQKPARCHAASVRKTANQSETQNRLALPSKTASKSGLDFSEKVLK